MKKKFFDQVATLNMVSAHEKRTTAAFSGYERIFKHNTYRSNRLTSIDQHIDKRALNQMNQMTKNMNKTNEHRKKKNIDGDDDAIDDEVKRRKKPKTHEFILSAIIFIFMTYFFFLYFCSLLLKPSLSSLFHFYLPL